LKIRIYTYFITKNKASTHIISIRDILNQFFHKVRFTSNIGISNRTGAVGELIDLLMRSILEPVSSTPPATLPLALVLLPPPPALLRIVLSAGTSIGSKDGIRPSKPFTWGVAAIGLLPFVAVTAVCTPLLLGSAFPPAPERGDSTPDGDPSKEAFGGSVGCAESTGEDIALVPAFGLA
jgi:hypothetical protein